MVNFWEHQSGSIRRELFSSRPSRLFLAMIFAVKSSKAFNCKEGKELPRRPQKRPTLHHLLLPLPGSPAGFS
jgi:hypothetical protein